MATHCDTNGHVVHEIASRGCLLMQMLASSLGTPCTTQTKGSLVTAKEEGKVGTCVFPFTYKDVTYTACASKVDYGGVGWCAFDSNYKTNEWGYCTEGCSKGTRTHMRYTH